MKVCYLRKDNDDSRFDVLILNVFRPINFWVYVEPILITRSEWELQGCE